jgi:hypothetical protein
MLATYHMPAWNLGCAVQEAVKLMFEWAELVARRLAKQTDKHRIRYFVASDSSTVIEMAQIRFGRENVLLTPGEPQVRPTSRRRPATHLFIFQTSRCRHFYH